MATKSIAPELVIELRNLYAEYPIATARATAALMIILPSDRLDGDDLRHFLIEDEKVAKIVRRIREIQGAE